MFFSHAAGAWVIGHVTYGRAVVFVASAIADFPTHPPKILSFYTTPVECSSLELFFVISGVKRNVTCFSFDVAIKVRRRPACGGQLDMATSGV